MKVLRKYEKEVKNFKIGDQIVVPLAEFGEFTATVHKIIEDGALFIFDDYVAKRPMNARSTNKGGYNKSDLKKWIDTVLFAAFPEEMRFRISNLTIPTVGQLFGHEDGWDAKYFEVDTDEQLPLMQERRNRVAYFDNDWEWGWLQNAVKREHSSSSFAVVGYDGVTDYDNASGSYGVRPEFLYCLK